MTDPRSDHSPVLQAVLDAIAGTLDPSTQIADHPNVKFAQMQRLLWVTENQKLLAALEGLCIDANRLCDRQLGGTYEDDCRRSIAVADAAMKKSRVGR